MTIQFEDSDALPRVEVDGTSELASPNAAEQLRGAFRDFEVRQRRPLRRWARAALNGRGTDETIFYPFGGPDFCTVHDLFPDAANYILVGREPAIVPPAAANDAFLLTALQHYLGFSYFITDDLGRHLRHPESHGIVPLLTAQIVHGGGSLVSVGEVDGGGIEIVFRSPRGTHRLRYYQQDLRDGHFSDDSPAIRALSSGPFATLLKCASYLPHETTLEQLRSVIREGASLLVQDPSGVPYATLSEWGWQVDLHGRFTADIPVFRKHDQSQLAAAYAAAGNVDGLGFGFGYLTDPERAALIVARPRGAR